MKKRFFTLFFGIAICSLAAVSQTNEGDVITLDLTKSLNPATINYTEGGYWDGTYNDQDYASIDFEHFSFSHLISKQGWGGYYWDGFTISKNGDNTNYGEDSEGWVAHQWGCMAGGGIKTNAEGAVEKDENGVVIAEQDVPYLLAYWGYYQETDNAHSLQTVFESGKTYDAVGIYVCNHPWPYYGNIDGNSFSRAFEEGDYFKLIIHGLDKDLNATGKSVEYTLAEYSGTLKQSDKWEWVDLSSLGEIGGLYYTMETTDSDPEYGPNTAVYFCMDKLQVSVPFTSGIESGVAEAKISVYPNPFADYVTIKTEADSDVVIYTASGLVVIKLNVLRGENTIDTSTLPQGTYILKCGSKTVKLLK